MSTASRSEPGSGRFKVLRVGEPQTRFFLIGDPRSVFCCLLFFFFQLAQTYADASKMAVRTCVRGAAADLELAFLLNLLIQEKKGANFDRVHRGPLGFLVPLSSFGALRCCLFTATSFISYYLLFIADYHHVISLHVCIIHVVRSTCLNTHSFSL